MRDEKLLILRESSKDLANAVDVHGQNRRTGGRKLSRLRRGVHRVYSVTRPTSITSLDRAAFPLVLEICIVECTGPGQLRILVIKLRESGRSNQIHRRTFNRHRDRREDDCCSLVERHRALVQVMKTAHKIVQPSKTATKVDHKASAITSLVDCREKRSVSTHPSYVYVFLRSKLHRSPLRRRMSREPYGLRRLWERRRKVSQGRS